MENKKLTLKVKEIENSLYKFLKADLPHFSYHKRQKFVYKYNNGYNLKFKLNLIDTSLKNYFLILNSKIPTKGKFDPNKKEITLYLLNPSDLTERDNAIEVCASLIDNYTESFRNVFREQLYYLLDSTGYILEDSNKVSKTSSSIDSFIQEVSKELLSLITFKMDSTKSGLEKLKELDLIKEALIGDSELFYKYIMDNLDKDLLSFWLNSGATDSFRIKVRLKKLQTSLKDIKIKELSTTIFALEKSDNIKELIENFESIFKSFLDGSQDFSWFFESKMDIHLQSMFKELFLMKNFKNILLKITPEDKILLDKEIKKVHTSLKETYEALGTIKEEKDLDAVNLFIKGIPERITIYSKKFKDTKEFLKDIVKSEDTLFGYVIRFILTDYEDLKKKNSVLLKYKNNLISIIEKSLENSGILKTELKELYEDKKNNTKFFEDVINISGDLIENNDLSKIELKDLIPHIETSSRLNFTSLVEDYPNSFLNVDRLRLYTEIIDTFLKDKYDLNWLDSLISFIKEGTLTSAQITYFKKFIFNIKGDIRSIILDTLKTGYKDAFKGIKSSLYEFQYIQQSILAKDLKSLAKHLKKIKSGTLSYEELKTYARLICFIPKHFKTLDDKVSVQDINLSLKKLIINIQNELEKLKRDKENFPEWQSKKKEPTPEERLKTYSSLLKKLLEVQKHLLQKVFESLELEEMKTHEDAKVEVKDTKKDTQALEDLESLLG